MQDKKQVLPVKKSRQVSIDLMECIAMLMVLIYHSTLYSSDIVSDPSAMHYFNYLFRTLLSPCVPLFFFANGFLLLNKELDLKKHLRKTVHLLILCVIWGIIKIFFYMPVEGEFLSPAGMFRALWIWREGWLTSLWFLGALVCIYIIFPVLKIVYDNNRKIFYYFIAICAIFTFGNEFLNEGATVFSSLVLNTTKTYQDFNFFNMFNPFRGKCDYVFVYFCLGGCFYNIKDRILQIRPLKRNMISILVMLVSCLGLWGVGIAYSKAMNEMWDLVWNGYDSVFTLVSVICIYVLCLNLKKDIRIIRTISSNTLGIYFIHEMMIYSAMILVIVFTKSTIDQLGFLCNIPVNIFFAIIILMLSLILTLAMKKIPIIKDIIQ